MAALYCHSCLDDMGLRKKRPKLVEWIDGHCPCCKRATTLFNIRDYQRKKESYAPKYLRRIERGVRV